MQIVEARAPDGFEALHDAVARDALGTIANRYE
jgi:hypothetical protein